jgi:hypothetical protein
MVLLSGTSRTSSSLSTVPLGMSGTFLHIGQRNSCRLFRNNSARVSKSWPHGDKAKAWIGDLPARTRADTRDA